MNGILLIDKPSGITSHDVVARIKRITKAKKVGHGGTLDPLATGVLPILINDATKLAGSLLDGDKDYLTTIKFGETTDTDDKEGKVISTSPVPVDLEDKIKEVVPKFLGKIEQTPPQYSAIKKNGKPVYKLARKGITVQIDPRTVEIKDIFIFEVFPPYATLQIKCSKGTYIRALARDIGANVGCGGHVTALRRVGHGKFSIEDAIELDKLSTLQDVMRVLDAPNTYDTIK